MRSFLFLNSLLLTWSSTTPLFLWSTGRHFASSGCSEKDTITGEVAGDDVLSGLKAIFGQQDASVSALSPLMSNLEDTHSPNVVVAFIVHQLSTARAAQLAGAYSEPVSSDHSLGFVKTKLDTSASCVSAPFVHSAQPISKLLSQALPETSQAHRFNLAETPCSQIATLLQKKAAAFTSTTTELIIVQSDSLAQLDGTCMASISGVLETAAQGNVVTLFSADAIPTKEMPRRRLSEAKPNVPRQRLSETKPNVLRLPRGYTGSGVQYTSPTIIIAILFMWFFIFFVYVGVYCLMAVETPTRFAQKPLAIAKEY